MRILVVAQGLVVLSAAAYTLKLDNPIFFYVVVTFGIFFTLAIQRQQQNYLGDFEVHLKSVDSIESALVNGEITGSWRKYKERHKELREDKSIFRMFVESGPYSLFIFVYVILIILKTAEFLEGFSCNA